MRSITRSITTVAKVAGTLNPSWRASRYGRIRSPALAGSRDNAANPMTVVRNAVRNRVGPMGSSRYCQRTVRTQNVTPTSSVAQSAAPAARA